MRPLFHVLLVLALVAPASADDKDLSFDDQWTPKGHLGKGDLPKETEKDWMDGRIRESDTGPFTNVLPSPVLTSTQ